MVQLVDSDIKTREVLTWKGVHLLHFATSSCSQKTRIVMNLKGIAWEGHLIDLRTQQNMDEWFMGINPRGLVPVLVHDGAVHIESNDIIDYLERTFPKVSLVPKGSEAELNRLLHDEDELHLDLRTVTMRFVFPPKMAVRPPPTLAKYAASGSGHVAGKPDARRAIEIAFWENLAKHGISDEQGRASALKFKTRFDEFDQRLATQPYLLGQTLSVLDIAWFIYANRLMVAGYTMEVVLAPPTREAIDAYRREQVAQGSSLAQVLARAA
jgi:glutathione S-transferase